MVRGGKGGGGNEWMVLMVLMTDDLYKSWLYRGVFGPVRYTLTSCEHEKTGSEMFG